MLIPLGFHSFWNQHFAMTRTLLFKKNTCKSLFMDLLAFPYLIYIICHNSILWFLILKKSIQILDGMTLCRITVAGKTLIFCDFWTVPKAFENMQVFNIIKGSQIALIWNVIIKEKVKIHNPWAQCTCRLITFSTFEVGIPIWVWININISSQHLIDENCFLQKEEILLLLLNSSWLFS